jgi:hypothetical protein
MAFEKKGPNAQDIFSRARARSISHFHSVVGSTRIPFANSLSVNPRASRLIRIFSPMV